MLARLGGCRDSDAILHCRDLEVHGVSDIVTRSVSPVLYSRSKHVSEQAKRRGCATSN
jgi:hypothetical protein